MTTFDIDPNTQTVASAWASSSLGQPEREVRFGFAPEPAADTEPVEVVTRRPVAKHAIIAAALACGIGGGTALGLMFLDFSPHQPAVTVPATPGHAVVVTDNPSPSAPQHAPSTVDAPVTARVGIPPAGVPGGPAVAPQPDNTPVPEQPENPQVPAPDAQEDPQVPAPEPPEEPKDPDPQPPEPAADDFKLPDPPKPEPDPEPPVVVDDFKLPPPPEPEPDPGPIFMPPLKVGP